MVWPDLRIIRSVNEYKPPYRITTDMMNASMTPNGGIVLRIPDIGINEEDPQEPGANTSFNRTGIVIAPNAAGDGMTVQVLGTPEEPAANQSSTIINIPLPLGQTNIITPNRIKFKLTVEDCGSSVYVFINDEPFFKIDLTTLNAGVYSEGSVIAPDESTIGTFTGMHVVQRGKIAFAQRVENLRLYNVKIEKNKNVSQTIDFESVGKKLTTDRPFLLNATATSNLPVEFSLVSCPATLSSGNTVTLTGDYGIVKVLANQSGDDNYPPAEQVEQVFYVEDPSLGKWNCFF